MADYPDLKIHGHVLRPSDYTYDDGTIAGKRFKGYEIYVTLNTGDKVTMILRETGLEAYNQAMDQKAAELKALAAAEKRLAGTTLSGVEGESGLVPPQER